jgi:subtilisin family serine protease
LNGKGSGSTADAIRAIDYALAHGARILSNSWGGPSDLGNRALGDAINRARARGVLFVAAAGNEKNDNDGKLPSYPAAFRYDNMITVAATDDKDQLAAFSNWGKTTTHVAAPGVKVFSTLPFDKYAAFSGTSMACPHVAGAAALLWAANPSLNYKQIKDLLLTTAVPLPSLKGKTITGARINLGSAMTMLKAKKF